MQYELAIAVKIAGCLGSPSEGDASNAPACEAAPVIVCLIGDVFKRTAINSCLFRVQLLERLAGLTGRSNVGDRRQTRHR